MRARRREATGPLGILSNRVPALCPDFDHAPFAAKFATGTSRGLRSPKRQLSRLELNQRLELTNWALMGDAACRLDAQPPGQPDPFSSWVRAVEAGLHKLAATMALSAFVEPECCEPPRDGESAYITLTGAKNTFMVGISATAEQQRTLAAALLGLEPDNIDTLSDSDVEDGFGELLNIVVGQVKTDVAEAESDLELGLPLFLHGAVNASRALAVSARRARFGEGELVLTFIRFPLGPEALRRRAEMQKRLKMEQELRLTQKLEAVGQLAAGIAHEINTPMQFLGDNIEFMSSSLMDLFDLVDSYVELRDAVVGASPYDALVEKTREIEDDIELPYLREQVPTALAHSVEGVRRVAAIVGAMREFGRPDGADKKPADLGRLIENALVVSRSEYADIAEVMTEIAADVQLVPCRASELSQVVLNLVVNAAHAMADKHRSSGTRGRLTLRTFMSNGCACIEVEDTGGGIPPAIASKVFDPFFTTKEVGRGTGQGLAIARTIVVDKHGGTLDFATRPGEGTTFRITLPLE